MISHLVVFVAVVMGMLPWILLCLPLLRLMANMFRHVPPGRDGGLHDVDLDDDPITPLASPPMIQQRLRVWMTQIVWALCRLLLCKNWVPY